MSDSNSTGFRKFGASDDGRVTGIEETGDQITKKATTGWTEDDEKGLAEETFAVAPEGQEGTTPEA